MADPATLTLTDFLLARIAEDEAMIGGMASDRHEAAFSRGNWPDGDSLIAISPARVLAECEAKRRIVELARTSLVYGDESEAEFDILAILAAVYADHPDYRDEWRANR